MPQFDAGADTPVGAAAVAANDKLLLVDVSGNAWETITASELLDALLLVSDTASGHGLLKRVGNVVVVRQPGGTAGTDEVQISHDGTRGLIESKDGAVRLKGATLEYLRSSDNTVIISYNGNDTLSVAAYLNASRAYISSLVNIGPQDTTAVQYDRPTNHVLRFARGGGAAGVTLAFPPLSPAQITSDQNNYPPGVSRYYRLTSDTDRVITGWAIGQVDGQEWYAINANTSGNIILAHQNAGSTAANRHLSATGADLVLAPGEGAKLVYDATTSRIRVWKA